MMHTLPRGHGPGTNARPHPAETLAWRGTAVAAAPSAPVVVHAAAEAAEALRLRESEGAWEQSSAKRIREIPRSRAERFPFRAQSALHGSGQPSGMPRLCNSPLSDCDEVVNRRGAESLRLGTPFGRGVGGRFLISSQMSG